MPEPSRNHGSGPLRAFSPQVVVEQLRVWAMSHEGGQKVVESMRRCVPFVRSAFLTVERRERRAEVDAVATRRREPWDNFERKRVVEGMRRGEPVEVTAKAVHRSCAAVVTMRATIRRKLPERMWRKR